jgi:hypothetical protein
VEKNWARSLWGLVGHDKEFGFYLKCDRNIFVMQARNYLNYIFKISSWLVKGEEVTMGQVRDCSGAEIVFQGHR